MTIRDYGLHDIDKLVGVPKVTTSVMQACPHCGCKEVYKIAVKVEDVLLKGGKGIGTYLGCAACPWASPMVTHAVPLSP